MSALLVVGYVWVASGFRAFTAPAFVAVVGGGLIVILVGRLRRPLPVSVGRPVAGGALAWAVLAGAAGAWELQSFLQHPRSQHPTLSSLTNTLLQAHASRAVALLAWLAGGLWLARR
jgi:hypothetical protein